MGTTEKFVKRNASFILSFFYIILFAIIPLMLVIFIIYEYMNIKEGATDTQDYQNDATNLDTSYNNSESNDLSNINFFNDNQYYSSTNATTYTNSNYVPTYEDTVYLTRSSLVSNSKPIYDTESSLGGFCSYTKSDESKTEEICNKISKEVCASTNCCVLLGGEKCVSGNANGPTMIANYNDPEISKKDHYYYDGKCFGNCINPTKY